MKKVVTAPAPSTSTAGNAAGSAGQVLFSGGFGAPTYAPWTIPQCANYANPTNNNRVHFGTFQIDSQIVGQPPYSGRFTLPAWSGGRTRCELYTPRSINRGGDDYYSLMVYPPAGFSPGTPTGGLSIAQLNWEGMPGAPVSLHAYSDHVTLRLDSGVCGANNTQVPCQFYSDADAKQTNLPPLYAVPRPMQLNVWHEIIVHVHWATDSTGVIEVWHRLKGQTVWTKTGSLTGHPTLAVDASGAFPSATGDKIGAYRAPSAAPVSVVLDGFARAVSFAAAAANVP